MFKEKMNLLLNQQKIDGEELFTTKKKKKLKKQRK